MILDTTLHSEAPVQLLAERSCGTSLLRRGFGQESSVIQIQLGGNRYANRPVRGHMLLDGVDAELDQHAWSLLSTGCAYRNGGIIDGKQKNLLAHRVVVERMIGKSLLSTEHVDHINGNRLDNRRANLRIVTNAKNCENKHGPWTHGHRGVSWDKQTKKWRASVQHNGRFYCLGRFDSIDLAAKAAEEKRTELGFLTDNA